MRGPLSIAQRLVICHLIAVMACCASCAQTPPTTPDVQSVSPGDRVTSQLRNLELWTPLALTSDSYRIGPGDTIRVVVQGRATIGYQANPDAVQGTDPSEVVVSPAGDVYLALVGRVPAKGKTIAQLEDEIETALSRYIKHFSVSVTLSKIRTINVWISGEVESPGPQILPAVSTVSLAVLQAGIKPTGSTRMITLVRGTERRTVDLYRMTITGDFENDLPLEPGDSIHVPPVRSYVEVRGEVTRPGRYEMEKLTPDSADVRVRDLLELCLGALPSAALNQATLERIGEDNRKLAIPVSLAKESEGDDPILQSGDQLVVPSVAAFQPIIRLIGEFKGQGVYQRIPGATDAAVENKSGIYLLKQGQTVLDVIADTGGVTPQADLKRARIERTGADGASVAIPLDLERLLVRGDKSADAELQSGDALVLPAATDRIHVFGEVREPGSFAYSPSRRLVSYLGDAGGPTNLARLSDVGLVRMKDGVPEVVKLDTDRAIHRGSLEGNPELQPGDVIFVPQKFVSGWRDGLQMVFTALSLASLLNRL